MRSTRPLSLGIGGTVWVVLNWSETWNNDKIIEAANIMRHYLTDAYIAARAKLRTQVDLKYIADGRVRDAMTSDEIDEAIQFLIEKGYIGYADEKSTYYFVA
jgi:hypothetical protein